MRPTLFRYGFLKRNIDSASNLTARILSVSGANGRVPDQEFISFRDPSAVKSEAILFSDKETLGGFSEAHLDSEPFPADEIPEDYPRNAPPPHFARFHGNINIELPQNRMDVERSGFAAWRTVDPGWTLFGKARFNCEALAFLALRVKADNGRYFVNLQADSIVATDLWQHRLFAKTPGKWETVYIPFTDFVKTHYGKVMKSQTHMPKGQLTTVGLGLIDRIPGPFNLCIDRIWATNSRDLDSLQETEEAEY
ncbi:complex I intermediate-associated protein 30-domain-containing protein [Pyronema omphalodes]|nr:complex I intermediate-associated protein 30-domain-containing protein [Pyronema omphalodes]